MNFKKFLFLTLACALPLAACNDTPSSQTKSKIVGDVIDFLETRNAKIDTIPFIEYADDAKVSHIETFPGDETYAPCISFVVEGDVTTPAKEAFATANWVASTDPAIEGFEYIDPTNTVETLFYYVEQETEEDYAGTNFFVCACADLNQYDADTEIARLIAIQIATAIYGATDALDYVEEYLGMFYTGLVVEGTDLAAAITGALRYIPDGFEQIDEVSVETVDGEEEGYASFLNEEGFGILVYSWAGEEAGTIEVTFLIVTEGSGGDDQLDTVAAVMDDFLLSRGVSFTSSIPSFFASINTADLVYSEVNKEGGMYYPYYYFVLEGDVVDEILDVLVAAGWTVPSTPSEYGYECVDANQLVEIDVIYEDEDDIESDIYAGTNCTVYAYSDLYGGGDGGDDTDWDDEAAYAVALEIATSIFGADAAEDNIDWFFIYFVVNTVDGTDLRAAIRSESQHIPAGFTQEGEIEITTEEDEETGESYELASAIFVNADAVVIDLQAALAEEQGKIDIMYIIYSDDTGDDDTGDDEPTTEEGDVNVVTNPDGSKTATLDFSNFADQSEYVGQQVGDLTVSVVMDANKSSKPTYYDKGNSLRIYWGTGLKFSVPQGQEILKVEFTCTDGNSKTVDVDDSNLKIIGGSYAVDGKDVTITGNQGVNELSMLINLTKGNVAITGISVTYK